MEDQKLYLRAHFEEEPFLIIIEEESRKDEDEFFLSMKRQIFKYLFRNFKIFYPFYVKTREDKIIEEGNVLTLEDMQQIDVFLKPITPDHMAFKFEIYNEEDEHYHYYSFYTDDRNDLNVDSLKLYLNLIQQYLNYKPEMDHAEIKFRKNGMKIINDFDAKKIINGDILTVEFYFQLHLFLSYGDVECSTYRNKVMLKEKPNFIELIKEFEKFFGHQFRDLVQKTEIKTKNLKLKGHVIQEIRLGTTHYEEVVIGELDKLKVERNFEDLSTATEGYHFEKTKKVYDQEKTMESYKDYKTIIKQEFEKKKEEKKRNRNGFIENLETDSMVFLTNIIETHFI